LGVVDRYLLKAFCQENCAAHAMPLCVSVKSPIRIETDSSLMPDYDETTLTDGSVSVATLG